MSSLVTLLLLAFQVFEVLGCLLIILLLLLWVVWAEAKTRAISMAFKGHPDKGNPEPIAPADPGYRDNASGPEGRTRQVRMTSGEERRWQWGLLAAQAAIAAGALECAVGPFVWTISHGRVLSGLVPIALGGLQMNLGRSLLSRRRQALLVGCVVLVCVRAALLWCGPAPHPDAAGFSPSSAHHSWWWQVLDLIELWLCGALFFFGLWFSKHRMRGLRPKRTHSWAIEICLFCCVTLSLPLGVALSPQNPPKAARR